MDGESRICSGCVGNSFLVKYILDNGTESVCDCCGDRQETVVISEIADIFDQKYRQFYRAGDDYPRAVPESDNPAWEQEGDYPEVIVAEWLGCDNIEIARAIATYLHDQEQEDVVKDGADAYYALDWCYVFEDTGRHYHFDLWRHFCERTKNQRRFYDLDAQKCLDDIFCDLGSLSCKGASAIRVLSPSQELSIFRGRYTDNIETALEWQADPLNHLVPNPRPRSGGRLNAPGIPMFYGSFLPETCISEIRPPVGSFAIVAEWELINEIKVLDLTVFVERRTFPNFFSPSFDTEYDDYLRREFLDSFHQDVSRPILPDDESVEYVPSQVVAEYLRESFNIDAIIFDSAQAGGGQKNIALFDAPNIIEGVRTKVEPPDLSLFSLRPSSKRLSTPEAPKLRLADRHSEILEIRSATFSTKKRHRWD